MLLKLTSKPTEIQYRMPKQKSKKEKSNEEIAAEGYFPVDVEDIKRSVEVPYKGSIPETVEPVLKSSSKRKSSYKKSSSKTAKKSSSKKEPIYSPQKIILKKDGYELIITEKPQAAQKIADSLDDNNSPKKFSNAGVSYYEITKDKKKIYIGCAVGHLFTLKEEKNGKTNGGLPIFDIKWVPNYVARKGGFTKKYYDTLLKLAKNAGSLTVATDYDIEGEVIGYNIVKHLAGQLDASRMKFSTLTKDELIESYNSKVPTLNWGQALAGESRHYLDWYYGINLSRALMNAIKTTGRFKIMSIGRVQGPALKLIVDKEKEIQKFVPTPYWQIFIEVSDGKNKVELKYNKDITKKSDLTKFESLKGKSVNLETKKSKQIIPPPEPFNLSTLQTESYKLFGFTPARTLQIAQGLYLSGSISYPRTSSQKLPPSIAYKDILKKVALQMKIGPSLLTRSKPVEGKKTDPAHPSIYPTGQVATMNSDEERLYSIIAKRFISLFCDDAVLDNKNIKATLDEDPSLIFTTKGTAINKKGWMAVYPFKVNERDIPDFNGKGKITSSKIEEKETQPPKRFSPASIVTELEKRNLGTKATRANIIETLYDRGYIKEKSIEATPLGMSLIITLEKHSPIIIDEKLTRHFEKEMDELLESKKKEHIIEKENKVIDEAKETVTKIINQFEKEEKEIGQELIVATDELREIEKKDNELMICPSCGIGKLAITYSRKNKKYFIACNAYPNCKTTFSLPPNGNIKKVEDKNQDDGLKKCEHCQFPLLMTLRSGKRPWIFCFNSNCPSNKARLDEYRKRQLATAESDESSEEEN
ncbi:DNA topoisomerase I [Candidatus Pacearchaeota archaeon CG10_big_fil_rev_8_21_14_0_10_32_14]|nr:MAG: DNA topoisomerase I [Candidatus Pacearchaeota archaeon CG10_big_fil_rev_8_21_14_0_10_32_14]